MTETKLPTALYLEKVMKLMTKYQVDVIELQGLKISKKIHQGPKLPKPNFKPAPTLIHQYSDEDVMFASSSAPRLTLEDFDAFTAHPIKGINDN
jgi:hypothetical protein